MIVMKFGGTVLHHETGFLSMVDIIKRRTEACIIVISAFSDITRRLDKSLDVALHQDIEQAYSMIDEIITYHHNMSTVLHRTTTDFTTVLRNCESLLKRLLKGVSLTKEISPKTRDLFLSQGEILAIHFVENLLVSHEIAVHSINACDIMITDNEHGNAKPLDYHIHYKIQQEITPLLQTNDVMIISGFIGSTEQGDITTMGYESSNLTASVIGSMLKATEIQIWSDVSGIRSADPKICPKSKPIHSLDYSLANTLAQNGLKILHHWMIDLPLKHNIPVSIRNAFDNQGPFTLIHDHSIQEIPTIFILTDVVNREDMQILTFMTTHPKVLEMLFRYNIENELSSSISVSTFIQPNLHKVELHKSMIIPLLKVLHSIIED
ncbi:MAG: hypothetical protein EBU66_08215 [Bacteroidetes bacterium]|nr:hypothetical protein [bacterium]NBP64631.1 hypothetical protein [Bacteroidota bacterium]